MADHIELEATELRGGYYAVRPKGCLGTCGWSPRPWTVCYVRATGPSQALHKAKGRV